MDLVAVDAPVPSPARLAAGVVELPAYGVLIARPREAGAAAWPS
jgi:hypothetical protein